MLIAGVDPGLDGALAFIDTARMRVHAVVDVPTSKKPSGRREMMRHELLAACRQALDGRVCDYAWIEEAAGYVIEDKGAPEGKPKRRSMGASSAFSFGRCYGGIEMLIAVFGWRSYSVKASVWKRVMQLGRDKARARALASEQFPADAALWTPRRGFVRSEQANGRAEAVLIALYGMRQLTRIADAAE